MTSARNSKETAKNPQTSCFFEPFRAFFSQSLPYKIGFHLAPISDLLRNDWMATLGLDGEAMRRFLAQGTHLWLCQVFAADGGKCAFVPRESSGKGKKEAVYINGTFTRTITQPLTSSHSLLFQAAITIPPILTSTAKNSQELPNTKQVATTPVSTDDTADDIGTKNTTSKVLAVYLTPGTQPVGVRLKITLMNTKAKHDDDYNNEEESDDNDSILQPKNCTFLAMGRSHYNKLIIYNPGGPNELGECYGLRVMDNYLDGIYSYDFEDETVCDGTTSMNDGTVTEIVDTDI